MSEICDQNIPALELHEVHYAYRSSWTFQSRSTLHGISLRVAPGESFGFLGPNGAGKTTTIKCILGLIKPRSGTIKVFGADSSLPAARQTIGYLSEQPYFYDYLTVQEIMEMYATLGGVPKQQLRARVSEALDQVKLAHRARSTMRSLSKGLTQRVAMAQAIVAQPRLLILDEPFSGLDPIGRREFKDLIFSLKRNGTAVFMSSHILSDVEDLCDRVSIMTQGKLRGVYSLSDIPRASGATYELTLKGAGPLTSELRQGATQIYQRGELCRLIFESKETALDVLATAIRSGITIESYHFVHGSLEDLFLKLIEEGESRHD